MNTIEMRRGMLLMVLAAALAEVSFGYEDTIERTFDFSGKSGLSVQVEDCHVSYNGEDRADLAVEIDRHVTNLSDSEAKAYLANEKVIFKESGDRWMISVESQRGGSRPKNVQLRQEMVIRGPRDMDFTVDLEDGHLELQAINGRIEVSCEDGNVSAADVSGELVISVEDGHVKLTQLRGSVIAELEDGHMDVGFADEPLGECEFELEDGNLKLDLPESAKATVTISVEDGETRIGGFGDVVLDSSKGQRKTYDLNGGGVAISIDVEDGNVAVN